MRYMIVEEFRDAVAVYRRLRDLGRQEPSGLTYVASWVTPDMTRCYQVMETEDRALLDAWMSLWDDVIEFEVVPVVSSEKAQAELAERL
jgi:hypothetical protein